MAPLSFSAAEAAPVALLAQSRQGPAFLSSSFIPYHHHFCRSHFPGIGCDVKRPTPSRLQISGVFSCAQNTSLPLLSSTQEGVDARPFASSELTWRRFSEQVCGTWDGLAYDISPSSGSPLLLPDSVVPYELSEWGISLFSWRVISTTLPEGGEAEGLVAHRLQCCDIRLLPATACDVETEYSRHQTTHPNASSIFGFSDTGSYASLTYGGNDNAHGGTIEIEHCLISRGDEDGAPNSSSLSAGAGAVARVRMFHVLDLREGDGSRLLQLSLQREQKVGSWEKDPINIVSMRCPVDEDQSPYTLEDVDGEWTTRRDISTAARSCKEGETPALVTGIPLALLDDDIHDIIQCSARAASEEQLSSSSSLSSFLVLPGKTWSSVRVDTEDGDRSFHVEAGWMMANGQALVSHVILNKEGHLQMMSIAHQVKRV